MKMSNGKCLVALLLFALGFPAYAGNEESEGVEVVAAAHAGAEDGGGGTASRADDAIDSAIRAAIKRVNPEVVPEYIGRSSVPGFLEVVIQGQVVFVTEDGHYLAQGMVDLRDTRDVAQFGVMASRRLEAMQSIPASERIVFAPEGPIRYTVSVFTDVECGFCRKMHEEIEEYNRLGIAVEYLAYPRAGLDSADAQIMESVWCSEDRRKAMTDAKRGVAVAPRKCANPVARHFEIAQRIGLRGTPMVIDADGISLPGYLPPQKMLEQLEKFSALRHSDR